VVLRRKRTRGLLLRPGAADADQRNRFAEGRDILSGWADDGSSEGLGPLDFSCLALGKPLLPK
jgi:hypothetical protein